VSSTGERKIKLQRDRAPTIRAALCGTQYATLAMVINAELHIFVGGIAQRAHDLRNQSQHLLRDVLQRGIALGIFNISDLEIALAVLSSIGVHVANWYTPSFH